MLLFAADAEARLAAMHTGNGVGAVLIPCRPDAVGSRCGGGRGAARPILGPVGSPVPQVAHEVRERLPDRRALQPRARAALQYPQELAEFPFLDGQDAVEAGSSRGTAPRDASARAGPGRCPGGARPPRSPPVPLSAIPARRTLSCHSSSRACYAYSAPST
jgi:hypothetical protein